MRREDEGVQLSLYEGVLEEVLTVPEVMRAWGKTQMQVMMAIYRDQIVARQVNSYKGTWLVARGSVIALWGQPRKEEK